MRRQQDMIGNHRHWLCLLGMSALALLSGCGMFDSSGPSPQSAKARSGADRQVAISNSLPAASSGRQYDSSIAPVDETRGGAQIGSIVPGRGGQKAQKEAAEKEAVERDAKAREQRQARSAAEKAKAHEPAAPAGAAPSAPPEAAVAAPAPVSAPQIPPPAADPSPAAQPATSSAPPPVPPAAAAALAPEPDPNKAFEPPPGWVPPSQAESAVVAAASPAALTPTSSGPPPAPAPDVMAAAPAPASAPATAAAPLAAVSASVAARPARPVDRNRAFEPPPGWVPPGQAAVSAVASTAPPQPAAEPAIAVPTDQALIATFDFARQSVELSNTMKVALDSVAKNVPGRIEVRSYFAGTDPSGRKVSLARALIVRSYLISQGVNSRTIEVGTFSAEGAGAEGERVKILASRAAQPAPIATSGSSATAPPAPDPVTIAAKPARPVDPNRAFEPPPGWIPPGQTAVPAVASTAPLQPAADPPSLPPTTPAPQPGVTAAPQAQPAIATPTNQALMATLDFARQSVQLSDTMKTELERVAKKVAGRSLRQIEVRSHGGGTDPHSRQVTLARALIVRSYLIDQGVKPTTIEVGTFSTDGAGAEGERIDILASGL